MTTVSAFSIENPVDNVGLAGWAIESLTRSWLKRNLEAKSWGQVSTFACSEKGKSGDLTLVTRQYSSVAMDPRQ